MARLFNRLGVLAKIETTYGTDAVPTGALNAVQLNNVTITPLAGEEVSRDLMLPYLGDQGVILAGLYAQVEGSVEIQGAGAAGTAPAYGPLLRGCGLAEVITAGTSVVYSPVSAAFEALTIYWNADGVNHTLLGARGTVTIEFTPKKIPYLKFKFTGLLGTIADTALPTVTLTAFKLPLIVSKANTPTFTLHTQALYTETLTIDLGNQVEPRFLIGWESVEVVDRKVTGSTTVEARTITTVDWFTKAKTRARGALQVVHGTTAGNIVQIDAPQVEIGRPTQGQTQNILNYTLPLMLCTNAGNDEITITVK